LVKLHRQRLDPEHGIMAVPTGHVRIDVDAVCGEELRDVRLTNSGLDAVTPDAQVSVLNTSTDSYDLAVPETVQTVYFQNGYLYVISNGVLQVYAMGDNSIVRTATLQVVNETLQASLFSDDHLYLSDFGWSNAASQRLLLPYSGQDDKGTPIERVGFSHVVTGSIDSEGAVELPELAQRIRPLPTGDEAYLTFARNSIEWLTADEKAQWHAAPVLEYFEPFALYRRSEAANNVELQRLGTRCRLYFAATSDLNQRGDGAVYSDEFRCTGYAQAYDHRFIFSATSGVEYGDDHSVRQLSTDEVTDTLAQIAARPYCLLSLELVDNPALDPNDLPPLDRFTCLSPSDYNDLRNSLSTNQP
jgi:hypothetical protein